MYGPGRRHEPILSSTLGGEPLLCSVVHKLGDDVRTAATPPTARTLLFKAFVSLVEVGGTIPVTKEQKVRRFPRLLFLFSFSFCSPFFVWRLLFICIPLQNMSGNEDDPLQELFRSIDRDGDGILTVPDLASVMEGASEGDVEDIIIKLNGGDGTDHVTFEQFSINFHVFAEHSGADAGRDVDNEEDSFLEDDAGNQYAEADDDYNPSLEESSKTSTTRQLFEMLDSDGDGWIIAADLEPILPDMDADTRRQVFSNLDKSATGKVYYDEFYAGFENLMRFARSHSMAASAQDTIEEETSDNETEPLTSSSRPRADTLTRIADSSGFSEMKEHLDSNASLSGADGAQGKRRDSVFGDDEAVWIYFFFSSSSSISLGS